MPRPRGDDHYTRRRITVDYIKARIVVDETRGCWLWGSATYGGGYGCLTLGEERAAHRVAYLLFVGPIPEGLWVLHRCDVRNCVNPEHLFLGTSDDNIHDMVEKRRHSRRSNHPCAKLTEEQVALIRVRRERGDRVSAIAHDYGVARSTISMIVTGQNWRERR